MNRKLLAAALSGTLALPMAAQAQAQADATLYGSLRYGVAMNDSNAPNSSTRWNVGANSSSRFGIRGSVEAGEGLTAGFQIERNLDNSLTPRHHNVSLSSGFGTVTLGQHSSPYYGVTTWDGAAHLGGGTDTASRRSGASWSSALGGPFDFAVFVGRDGGRANHREVTGRFAAGPVSFSAGFMQDVNGGERLGGGVSGSVANISWGLGYEAGTDLLFPTITTTTCRTTACDEDRYGFHVGYAVGGGGPGGGNAYVQFASRDSDDSNNRDVDSWVLGYSHYVTESVTVDAVYRTQDGRGPGVTTTASVLVLKIDF